MVDHKTLISFKECESTIVNSVKWADIPIESTETVFIQEQEFDIIADDRAVDLHPDPTPKIEAPQVSIVIRMLVDTLDSDEKAVRTLLADGRTEPGGHVQRRIRLSRRSSLS